MIDSFSISKAKPPWLRRRIPPPGRIIAVKAIIKSGGLNTVCVDAKCPNQLECFSSGTATFLLLGPGCTRHCTFCAVDKSRIIAPDPGEPECTAQAVAEMGLTFCVLTMVTRDDLPDGGALHIVKTIEAIRKECPRVRVEVLISDLGGNLDALKSVLATKPEVLNHNIETVPRLYPEVRPQASYKHSLELLARAAAQGPPIVTKSGLMLGLGETNEEVLETMYNIRDAGCLLLTIGQYLAPSDRHHPVVRYISPEEFASYEAEALALGFSGVASAPLVRSSYGAERLYHAAHNRLPF